MSRSLWLPPNGSQHGAVLDRLLVWNLGALTALLLVAHLVLVYALMRRRRLRTTEADSATNPAGRVNLRWRKRPRLWPANGNSAGANKKTLVRRGSSLLPPLWSAETAPVLLCCLLFAAMAVTSERFWAALRFVGPSPAAMQVEVIGVQFQWYFRYPGPDARLGLTRAQLVNAAGGNPLGLDPADKAGRDDVVSSVLVLPVGREVDLRLRAHDVMHGFFIPGMRLKENAVPGLELHVHFTPITPGTYPILCTQVCGSGHSRMQALLRIVPPEEFSAWMAARERALEHQVGQ